MHHKDVTILSVMTFASAMLSRLIFFPLTFVVVYES